MSEQISGLKKVLFIALAATLMFLILEVLLQGFYFATVGDFLFRRALPEIYESDPIRCYRVKPNLELVHRTNEFEIDIFTNSIGVRTGADHREISKDKGDDVYRILFTGPSFAFGWGSNYEEIYATLVERGLQHGSKRVEVMNLGTPSQGSAEQLCWLEQEGYKYAPDMVIHTSYGREVTARASSCPAQLDCPRVENGQLVPSDVSFVNRVRASLKRFGTVFYGYYAYNFILRPEPAADASKALHSSVQSASRDESRVDRVVQSYVDHEEKIKSILGPETAVGFVYLPYSYLVHRQDVARFSDVYPGDIAIARERISETVARLQQRDVKILNTLPALLEAEAGSEERLYYWLDIHFTPTGNRVVAEAAIPFIEDLM